MDCHPHCLLWKRKKNSEALCQHQIFSWNYSDRIILHCDPFYFINTENHLAHRHFILVPKYCCRCSSLSTLLIQKGFGEGILGLHLPARPHVSPWGNSHTADPSGQCGLKGRIITHGWTVPCICETLVCLGIKKVLLLKLPFGAEQQYQM